MTDEQQGMDIDTNELIAQRRSKLDAMRKRGKPYPNGFERDALASRLHAAHHEKTEPELEAHPIEVKVAGRMMTRRLMGKASFLHLQDMSGQIQLYVRQDEISPEAYAEFLHWDIGDILGVHGKLFKTKTGELSIRVSHIELLTKSLRPLPDKYHGLTDLESRYRQRYLDLMVNEETRQLFIMRTKIIDGIRQFLKARDFLEVETPMMQVLAGGAAARPFKTHHNALDLPLYLRIAPELYLKRLVVGGFERVFEINRNFRNEGLSTRHNPEFTMLEFYQAYADYRDLMDLSEELLRTLAKEVLQTTLITYQEHTFDLSQPFQRMTVLESILHFNPSLKLSDLDDLVAATKTARALAIPVKESDGLGKVQVEIFEKTVESKLIQPTFITAYPAEVSPLARRNDDNPFVTDRFELFVGGREIANGFSELNDADDQAERFRKQVACKEAGDEEAMPYDEDYVIALEYGMPPTAGEGIGIDRLVMLFTNSASIRDVILFPHMRPMQK
ncbi:MAG TPA: lysine--tRNA ligase [Gammaproteobacteria bacterium]|nr:lysine--tRNA ligase [Gammaproteobacteria bacterium]